ncbi:hypothetical protein G9A89_007626 [Geosiphon pyriformis]|nr:hypothetical protein G9A89_007626 [Geosiphon pyriformis]
MGLLSDVKSFGLVNQFKDELGVCAYASEAGKGVINVKSLLAPSVISIMANVEFGSDMVLDDPKPMAFPFFSVSSGVSNLGSSSSKILTSKVGCLKSKLMALKASIYLVLEKSVNILAKQDNVVRWHVDSGNNISIITETKLKSGIKPWIMNRFPGVRIFMLGLNADSSGADVTVIMNFSVAQHVSKIDEIPGRLILIRLLFKGKLSVTILGIYAGASASVCFGQAFAVNFMITSAINSSSFVILDGDFNELDTKKSASLRKYVDLGLVNSFKGHSLASLFIAVLEFFDTDHKMISVSIGLEGLLNAQLNSIHKQTNKNRWKFDFKNADLSKWLQFKDNVSTALSLVIGSFLSAKVFDNLNEMWDVLCGVMVRATDATFSRRWFSEFDCSRNKHSLRFLGLELLMAKVVKSLNTGNKHKCNHLIKRWFLVDCKEAFKFDFLVQNGADLVEVFKHLFQVRKCYRKSKYYESRVARNMAIRSAINKYIENFSSNKGGMIRSVLEWPFCKIVLDYLVIGDELVLDPIEVKSRVNNIMVN